MGKKIVFVFAGTNESAQSIRSNMNKILGTHENSSLYDPEVVRVYFSGCHEEAVGGAQNYLQGLISPNLDTVADNIRQCMTSENNICQLSLTTLKKIFGDSVVIDGVGSDESLVIDEIDLTGFSRGGVATFAVARKLDDLGKPISLFAQEPVPGESKQYTALEHSSYSKNIDLRPLKNVKKAVISLGVYRKDFDKSISEWRVSRGVINKYFRQMAPLFSKNCDYSITIAPLSDHMKGSSFHLNQLKDYFIKRGIVADDGRRYIQNSSSYFFTPKIIQQQFHAGVVGRANLLLDYKLQLWQQLGDASITANQSFKKGQAQYALLQGKPMNVSLFDRVRTDETNKGKALRDEVGYLSMLC